VIRVNLDIMLELGWRLPGEENGVTSACTGTSVFGSLEPVERSRVHST
jgi:hypothetical protein